VDGMERTMKDSLRRQERCRNTRLGHVKSGLAARLELLKAEKELMRRIDELPWVRINKKCQFETDEENASLADIVRGRSQLLIYHST
jgi:predicted dithiol-disulfide oxidoreductase (DUF899 family)